MDEAHDNLLEAVQLVLKANREIAERGIGGKEVTRERLLLRTACSESI